MRTSLSMLALLLFLAAPALLAQESKGEKGRPADPGSSSKASIDEPLDEFAPLGDLAKRMDKVSKELAAGRTDRDVQARQQDIVSHIDELIARLRRKQGG